MQTVVAGNAYVMRSARVTDQARVTGKEVSGNAVISDSAQVIESGRDYDQTRVYVKATEATLAGLVQIAIPEIDPLVTGRWPVAYGYADMYFAMRDSDNNLVHNLCLCGDSRRGCG